MGEIKFKYMFDDRYDPEYVNGVFGGVNVGGELIMQFYLERMSIPYEETVGVTEEGVLTGDVIASEPEQKKFLRTVKSGIVVNKEFAILLRDWLDARIEEMAGE